MICFDGRPVIGILDTCRFEPPCNAICVELAERVKIGVYEGWRVPVEFPVSRRQRSTFRQPR